MPPKIINQGSDRTLMDSLTSSNGTSIRLDRLAALLLGIIATAFGEGVANFVEGVFDAFLISPIEGVADFITSVFLSIRVGFNSVSSTVWTTYRSFLANFGPFAYLVAVLLMIAIAFLLVKGRDWSG
ncbi:hypothetical protein NKF26_12095 [Haladaptatus sp. AB618]|uniref:hypothetical protein n=1 Tax=Haladaptatus sp. AB618 TaxID=2934173 RepID=UPI00209BDAB2|nr:hypothetical protein [Haladaptatus sp. AB618]MCO8254544.1 hypothetical protein [Haladaptatus sp. AB618]